MDGERMNDINELYWQAIKVRRAMRVCGGSFMQAIGNALDVADNEDIAKIRQTWPDEWSRYLKMAEDTHDI